MLQPSHKNTPIASASYTNNRKQNKDRCYECGDSGHVQQNCPYYGTGKFKCYECNKFARHIAANCPERVRRLAENMSTTQGKSTFINESKINLHAKNERQFKSKTKNKFDNKTKTNRKTKFGESKTGRGFTNDRFERQNKTTQRTGTTRVPLANLTQVNESMEEGKKLDFYNEQITSLSCNLDSNLRKTTYSDTDDKLFTTFIIDTGATEHLTNTREIFSYLTNDGKNIIKCANKNDNANLIVKGRG